MAITETVTLDMTPGGIMPIVYASQYDAGGRILAVSLTDHGTPHTIPDGATVQIRGTKRDKKGFAYTGKGEGSTAYFTLEQQMTAAAGDVICEVRITDADGGIIGSANFILRVEPAGLSDDTDTSATEIPAIEDAAKSYAERAETAAKKAEEAAAGASAGVSPTVAMEAIDGGTRLTITDKDGEHVADILNGSAGAKGDKGDAGAQGPQGETGADGISPTVTTVQTETGADITITDKDGSHTVSIADGKDGEAGAKGADGVSPTVSLTAIDNGTRITITDAGGEHTADIQNGATGPQGATGATGSAGADGYSPTVEIAEIAGGKRITITDKTGTHTADIMNGSDGKQGAQGPAGADGKNGADGIAATVTIGTVTTGEPGTEATVTNIGTASAAILDFVIPRGATGAAGASGKDGTNGKDGADGVSPTVSVAQTDTGATITITDKSGAHTATILNGADGERGPAGEPGKDGADGKNGADGEAATVTIGTVTTGESGTSATVTNSGTANAAVLDFVIPRGATGAAGAAGKDGADGKAGADGVSPTVSIAQTDTGATITITDKSGEHTATILNGKNGEPGTAGAAGKDGATGPSGADGVSPTVTLTAITGGTRLTITDANGQHSADIMNGTNGATGATGPAYTLTDSDKSAIVSAVLAQMTNAESEAL